MSESTGSKPCVFWLYGLSSSGKSTLGDALKKYLDSRGISSVRLDGDELRAGLCRDLGFTAHDRSENIRRAAEIARLLCAKGQTVIATFMTPEKSMRTLARSIVQGLPFYEVYLKCRVAVCQSRDPKGLYRRHANGTLSNLPGIDLKFEAPDAPECVIDTETLPQAQSIEQIILFTTQVLGIPRTSAFSPTRRISTPIGSSIIHGCYYQVHKKSLAVYKALESYRRHNPASPVHLVSDGGDDFSDLAHKFGCHYEHCGENIGFWRNQHSSTDHYLWLERVQNACLTTFKEVQWVVILEPDVDCYRPPSHQPRFALNGGGGGPMWSPPLLRYFESRLGVPAIRKGGLGHTYTGAGGSIFAKAAYIESFKATPRSLYEDAVSMDRRIAIASDAAISFLLHAHGHDTGAWSDWATCLTENPTQYAFVHGSKRHYHAPYPQALV